MNSTHLTGIFAGLSCFCMSLLMGLMNSLISNNLNLILTIYLHSFPERGIQVRPQTTPSSAAKGVPSLVYSQQINCIN